MKEIIEILEKSFIQISEIIRNQNSLDLGTHLNKYNISGDDVKHLDIVSNIILKNNLEKCELIRNIGSEEEAKLYNTEYIDAPYLICYDPLDGSSNIDVNITTGTIFALYKYDDNGVIQDGNNIVMSGYCLYGGCTQYLLAQNRILSMYQYNTVNNSFVCIHNNILIKQNGNIYSLNESNSKSWNDLRYKELIDSLIKQKYTARWVGSLVADGHRTLMKGGFFAYPGNISNADGKIRLLYEAYPFAHIFETAGGIGSDGNINILDIPFPYYNLHKKTPIILSSTMEFSLFRSVKEKKSEHNCKNYNLEYLV